MDLTIKTPDTDGVVLAGPYVYLQKITNATFTWWKNKTDHHPQINVDL